MSDEVKNTPTEEPAKISQEVKASSNGEAKEIEVKDPEVVVADAGPKAPAPVKGLAGSPNFDEACKEAKIKIGALVQKAFDSTAVDEEYWNSMNQVRRDRVIQRTLDNL